MYSRALRTPEQELEEAKRLLLKRFELRMESIGIEKPPAPPQPGRGPTAVVEDGKAKQRQDLQEELRAELGNLDRIRTTEDCSGRTAAQLARDALVPLPEKQRDSHERPKREFNVQGRSPLSDNYRVDIENEASKDDPQARSMRAYKHTQNLLHAREKMRERSRELDRDDR